LCSSYLIAQTEIWKVPSFWLQVAPDGKGGFYASTASGNFERVNSSGTILWSTPWYPADGIWSSGSGAYVNAIVRNESGYTAFAEDTIAYFDSTGVLVWTYGLPDSVTPCSFLAPGLAIQNQVDRFGNLIISYAINSTTETVIELRPSGQVVFKKKFQTPTINPDFVVWFSPVVDPQGSIWLLWEVQKTTTKTGDSSTSSVTNATDVVSILDDATGTVIFTENILNQTILSTLDNTRKGIYTQYTLTAGLLYVINAGFINGSLVLAGNYNTELTKGMDNGGGVLEDKTFSEWQVLTIAQSGKISQFTYRGSGKVNQGVATGDGDNNVLLGAVIGNNNMIYLNGQYITGLLSDNANTLVTHAVTMGVAFHAKNPTWVSATGPNYYITYYPPAQKVLLPETQGGSGTPLYGEFKVYDGKTGVQSTSIQYPPNITSFAASFPGYFPTLNNASGYIYDLITDNSTQPAKSYLAKFSVTSLGVPEAEKHAVAARNVTKTFSLSQNYPNPFNPTTTFSFTLPSASFATLKIYNVLGEEVSTVMAEQLSAGNYSRTWNASGFASGIYYYRLQAGSYVQTKKLELIK
jgi:hypothetical protein